MSPTDVASDVMTTEEVMGRLGVSARQVYRIAGHDLPAFRVGRGWRFLRRDVDAYIERQKRLAASRPKGTRGRRRRT